MTPPVPSSVLALADSAGWETCVAKGRAARSSEGQFFTPAPIARFLAGWFDEASLNRPAVHLLDPGAGGGALTAAVVDRIALLRSAKRLPWLREVTLEAWELDKSFFPTLRKNLTACADALAAVGIRANVECRPGNYIEGAVRALDPGLFGTQEPNRITHAILNPPYRKISTTSRERALLRLIGIETTNLYAAFVWLALRQLVDGGELSAITPRSFCNGPYFREFRRELLELSAIDRIHLFDSRKEAFGRDEVLQENILFHLIRGGGKLTHLTLSNGSLEAPVATQLLQNRLVASTDRDQIIHLATESDSNEVRDFFNSLPCKLTDLGIEVSTGPVVDFRLKSSLSERLLKSTVPLIYPHCIKAGCVLPPLARSADYSDARIGKKPVAIEDNEETHRWLVPAARFVLIKRFSSKEERRRLVAGVLEPKDFPEGPLGLENHVNFFHRKRAGLSAPLARGLCRFLNSTVADRFFRHFNGHTQVNASDLRAFRYPDLKTLEQLGRAAMDSGDQAAIDLAMTKILGAPSFA